MTEAWVLAAQGWSEAVQGLVGAAGRLSLVSRELADELHGDGALLSAEARADSQSLAEELRLLAERVENETRVQRDRYLETAANVQQYRDLLAETRGG